MDRNCAAPGCVVGGCDTLAKDARGMDRKSAVSACMSERIFLLMGSEVGATGAEVYTWDSRLILVGADSGCFRPSLLLSVLGVCVAEGALGTCEPCASEAGASDALLGARETLRPLFARISRIACASV